MLSNHLPLVAKLFQTATAKITASAANEVMHTNAISWCDVSNPFSETFDASGDFVSERHRQSINLGNAAAVMRVRMTDSSGSNANQNVGGADLWNWNFRVSERLPQLHELDGFHRAHLAQRLMIDSLVN
jgi:hypothetical protein